MGKSVRLIDENEIFVGFISPAQKRYLLKHKLAKVYRTKPFTIVILPWISRFRATRVLKQARCFNDELRRVFLKKCKH